MGSHAGGPGHGSQKCRGLPLENDKASTSDESTIAVEVPGDDAHSLVGPGVARVEPEPEAEVEVMEPAGVAAEDGEDVAAEGMQTTVEEVTEDVHATQPDSLPEGWDALHGNLDGVRREPGGENAYGGDGEGDESAAREEEHCGGEEMDLEDGTLPAEAPGAVTLENTEPYVVPAGWAAILNAWNDPAIGAGLPDSMLSCGDFQHGGSADDDAVDVNAVVAASSSALPSASGPPTEGLEVNEGRAQQTDLKSWLKKG